MGFLQDVVNPSGVALDDGDAVLTYRDLYPLAAAAAEQLGEQGIGPGSVVGLPAGLDGDTIVTLHGIWTLGGSVAPLDLRWTKRERERALEVLRPTHLLDGPVTVVRAIPHRPDPAARRQMGPGEEVARLLTSGTSGRPRVVRLSFRNLEANAQASRERLALGPSDRWLASLSPSHVGGLALVCRAALLGSALVSRGPFNVSSFIELAVSGTITHASLVPTMLHQVLDAWGDGGAPDTLRCLLIGGAHAPLALVRSALEGGFPISLTYGLTEAASQVASAPPDLVLEKPGTVGPPLPGVRVRIGDGNELLIRGPTVALGEAGADGWLRTGDLARLDQDKHLWILGRKSDRIVTGGVNVDPAEVEEVLRTHPRVLEAVVVGVPDEEWGERVVAGVVRRRPEDDLIEELEGLVGSALSSPKRPRAVRFLERIPMNPNGKVDREAVRALFQ